MTEQILRSPEAFCLPVGYKQQEAALTHDSAGGVYWTRERIEASTRWQHHVYAWARRLIERDRLTCVLDVGCGTALKLQALVRSTGLRAQGLDMPSGVEVARQLVRDTPTIAIDEIDLEAPDHSVLADKIKFDIVVCADVLEHLMDPAPCIELLKAAVRGNGRGCILVSTPERERLRGRACMGSPKPEHVREWARGEFLCYLHSRGLRVLESVVFPPQDEAVSAWTREDVLWQVGLRETSPRWCHAVLCAAE